jgi:membrane protease YdiL (CAAX protease family)
MDLTVPDSTRTCDYCGHPLVRGYYFCTACAMPHSNAESVLPQVRPAVLDTETTVRRKAPEVVRIFFWYMGALFACAVLGWILFPGDDGSVPRMILETLGVAGVSVGFGIVYREMLKPQLMTAGMPSRYFGASLLILAGLLMVNFAWTGFLHGLLPDHLKKDTLSEAIKLVPTVAGRVFLICAMPAIFEEIGFRGLAQTWLMRVISPWKAVIVSAGFFSAAHLNILGAPYLFLVGGLFGWVRWRTGSLYPGMILHLLHNLAVLWYGELLN